MKCVGHLFWGNQRCWLFLGKPEMYERVKKKKKGGR